LSHPIAAVLAVLLQGAQFRRAYEISAHPIFRLHISWVKDFLTSLDLYQNKPDIREYNQSIAC
jgi:hypothetical protein